MSRSASAVRLGRSAWAGLMRIYRFLAAAFTRSLQLRIVVLTILLTIIAVYGVGSFMAQQISRGLFEAKLSSVSTQMSGYAGELESLSPGEDDSALSESLNVQLRGMLSRSPTPLRSIALEPRERSSQVQPTTAVMSGREAIAPSAMPDAFRNAVSQAQAGEQLYQSVELPGPGSSPGLILAQQVTVPSAGQFDLYVVADLQEEQNTLDFVQRVLIVAALVLVVLVGAVAWIVTRLVVVPVRTGSEVARKLSDGDLDQRMPVQGNDELATLAQSFNDMADTLQDQITRMEQLTVLQRQFVSDVSHELRTPLTTIQMASDVIYESRDELDESHRRIAELLNSQVERFETLLNDLLEISRHDAGAAQLVTKPADVCEVVSGVIDTLTMVADHADTEIILHAPSAPVMAEIDRVRINRVVRNLIVNAIEHGEQRRIDVFVAANAEAVAVSVRDHGVGMSEEQVEHVFDRFWRADPSRRRTLGGSGLGLAISLEDAHLHGGWLQAWGRVGEGSCFRLTIPRREGQSITTSPLPLPPADARVGGTALVAGPATSDGSLRIQTGSIPIVVETQEASDETA
ncbi:MtrAB system histidine kinase MtrB [Brevibacterium luteolum]|uniref:MtrAB system histidine kinase MtrB n=2 Tax=Brevibacterium luteolum TaxID=199591 RepID=UPI0021B02336|nr:MtrAB system histidine kinase MtrB [Brevibacterium luteolum]MCT1874574.1 MtrAB system histidine kinase MtrB [Brevibacterium luteolum]MCT1891323.1 MtrAB system histidine kinase MtrB [Brevibacterium luteolum]MCT1893374.1 MtrAB system histidine kinase MtrB [Brevibacterium luteolum]MCT1925118.1 MtrAB system histidine kinase MtrB [Brevibacterium luteolum]